MEPGDSVWRHGTSEECIIPEAIVRKKKYFKFWPTIEPVVLAVFFAETLTDSATTNFILIRTCMNHFHYNQSVCYELGNPGGNQSEVETLVQPHAAVILTGMSFISIFFPALFSLFAGPWSDYNGRKLLLVLPAVGYSLRYVMLGIFWVVPSLDPEYGLLAVLPVALSGGIINFLSAAYVYVSDMSKSEDRFLRISFLELVMGIGNFLGLLSVSHILNLGGEHGYIIIYGLSSGLIVLTTIYTFFFIPESVKETERGRGLLHVFEMKLPKEMFQVCFKKREGHKRAIIFLIIVCLALTVGAGLGESNVIFLFTRLQFGWNIEEFTFWSSISFVAFFLGNTLMSVIFSKGFKVTDSVLGMISFFMKSVSHFFIGLIPHSAPQLMFYACIFTIFGGISSSVCRAILSKVVEENDLGKVFALAGTSESILPLIMGPIYTALYNYTLDTVPGTFLILSGSVFLLCTSFFVVIYFIQKRHGAGEIEPLNESTEGKFLSGRQGRYKPPPGRPDKNVKKIKKKRSNLSSQTTLKKPSYTFES